MASRAPARGEGHTWEDTSVENKESQLAGWASPGACQLRRGGFCGLEYSGRTAVYFLSQTHRNSKSLAGFGLEVVLGRGLEYFNVSESSMIPFI